MLKALEHADSLATEQTGRMGMPLSGYRANRMSRLALVLLQSTLIVMLQSTLHSVTTGAATEHTNRRYEDYECCYRAH